MNPVVNDTLGQAQRSIASARALFHDGLVPECQEYMLKALRALVEAWLPVAPAEADPERPSNTELALRALDQAHYRRPERLRAALAVAEKSAAGSAANPADFVSDSEWLWTEIDRLNRFTVKHFKSPAARKRQRIQRGIALGLGLLVALLFLQRLWGRPHAHASAVYSEDYLARLAVDGLDATEWLLPENTPGWIDVLPPRARTLHGVVLTNAHNGYGVDRAARNVRVTAYSDAGPVGSVESVFETLTPNLSVLNLPLEAKDVVRVRVEVLSFHQRGGGLAEVELR